MWMLNPPPTPVLALMNQCRMAAPFSRGHMASPWPAGPLTTSRRITPALPLYLPVDSLACLTRTLILGRHPNDPNGDINLLEEIRFDNETGIVGRQHPESTRGRRMYCARVDGRKSGVTVAVYQGKGAEEVCGAASSGGLHATLFHDGVTFDLNGLP
ncbi:hypothetical protein B0H13DRAFT_1878956 [Mycena leptocephala]|nr:hypothetical protein B0H13DRAFT_1878956 [Mycena leptocephala]